MTPETYRFEDDGAIPNSGLPVLIYRDVPAARAASACEDLFAGHGWLGSWRNGIFPFHHFHSTAHEVLGVVRGSPWSAAGALGGVSENGGMTTFPDSHRDLLNTQVASWPRSGAMAIPR